MRYGLSISRWPCCWAAAGAARTAAARAEPAARARPTLRREVAARPAAPARRAAAERAARAETAGTASGGAAGSGTGGAAGGGGSAGQGSLSCSSGQQAFSYTVTQGEQFKRIPLPLTPGVEYRRVTLSFDYTPTQWSGTCYNPAGGSNKAGFPKFESFLALKRGNHWCKGGNLFEVTLQGPAPGHGASNKAIAQSFYKAKQYTGSGCGGSDVEAKIFNGSHGLSEGAKYHAEVVYDADLHTLSADFGPTQHSGSTDATMKLVANGSEVWNVVMSFDGGYLECYNDQGQKDPNAPCCYGPSIGWVFENLSWELCY